MSTPTRAPRLDSLTALRFFAAFGVTLCHLAVPLRVPGSWGLSFIFWQFGVDFFFVLSGFVLTWSWKPARSAPRFYWLRFARIWPLHLSVLLILLLLGTRGPLKSVLAEVFLVHQWYPRAGDGYRVGLNGVDWTLSVEVLFYLIFPFIVRPLHRMSSKALIALTAAGWLAFGLVAFLSDELPHQYAPWIDDSSPYSRLPQFLLGVTIAFCLQRIDTRRVSIASERALKAIGLLGIFLLVYVFSTAQTPTTYSTTSMAKWSFPLTPAIACTIIGFALTGMRGASRTPKWLVTLGEWSFAMYLIHRGVVYDHLLPHLTTLPRPLAGAIAIVVSIALAGLIYTLVERPVEKWLRTRGPQEPPRAEPSQ